MSERKRWSDRTTLLAVVGTVFVCVVLASGLVFFIFGMGSGTGPESIAPQTAWNINTTETDGMVVVVATHTGGTAVDSERLHIEPAPEAPVTGANGTFTAEGEFIGDSQIERGDQILLQYNKQTVEDGKVQVSYHNEGVSTVLFRFDGRIVDSERRCSR